MTSTKTNAPLINLDEQTYKLCDFSEDLAKYVANNLVEKKSNEKDSKQLITWNSKGILRIEMKNPYCPECNSTSINLNALYYRKLYYYDKGEVNAALQKYKCKKCDKEFITDIKSIVEDNSNFTLDFKEKTLELVGLFYGSVRKVAQRVKNDTGINISHQTIENWILDVEKP
ncbi:MAG: hypothetical protein LBM26_03310, partial [Methanobrevibacter sp.]|nr:hypothetical protein [Methanobrevibacter sp.]